MTATGRSIAGQAASGGKTDSSVDTHLFDKTKLCKFHAKGRCRRGPACTFAHAGGELRPHPDFYKTQLCTDLFRNGLCERGAACCYAHAPHEIRRTNLPKRPDAAASRARRSDADSKAGVGKITAQKLAPAKTAKDTKTSGGSPTKPTGEIRAKVAKPAPKPPSESSLSSGQPEVEHAMALASANMPVVDKTMFGFVAKGFSRQSTEEGPAEDMVGHLLSWAESSEGDGSELHALDEAGHAEQEVECDWRVVRTFLCLLPTARSSDCAQFRSESAPPGRCRGVATRAEPNTRSEATLDLQEFGHPRKAGCTIHR